MWYQHPKRLLYHIAYPVTVLYHPIFLTWLQPRHPPACKPRPNQNKRLDNKTAVPSSPTCKLKTGEDQITRQQIHDASRYQRLLWCVWCAQILVAFAAIRVMVLAHSLPLCAAIPSMLHAIVNKQCPAYDTPTPCPNTLQGLPALPLATNSTTAACAVTNTGSTAAVLLPWCFLHPTPTPTNCSRHCSLNTD